MTTFEYEISKTIENYILRFSSEKTSLDFNASCKNCESFLIVDCAYKKIGVLFTRHYDYDESRYTQRNIYDDEIYSAVVNNMTPVVTIGDKLIYEFLGSKISQDLVITVNSRYGLPSIEILINGKELLTVDTLSQRTYGVKTMTKEFIDKYYAATITYNSYYNYLLLEDHSNGTFDILLKDFRRRFNLTGDEAAAISLERQLRLWNKK